MAHKIKLTKEICLSISKALHKGSDTVRIGDVDYRFDKASSGYRYLDVMDQTVRNDRIRFQKQNPSKPSTWGQMAKKGHRITWGLNSDPKGWIRIVDDNVEVF